MVESVEAKLNVIAKTVPPQLTNSTCEMTTPKKISTSIWVGEYCGNTYLTFPIRLWDAHALKNKGALDTALVNVCTDVALVLGQVNALFIVHEYA